VLTYRSIHIRQLHNPISLKLPTHFIPATMSLVERLFPPAELAAMRHAVLAASDEPAAKRRKVERQDSIRSFRSADSGYNSDDSAHHKNDKSPSTIVPVPRKPSVTMPASPSAHSNSEEEEYTDVIARARARLYSNASMTLPSPPASHTSSNSPPATGSYENYHSPVSVEPITASNDHHSANTTSGCNLGTFISLGLAVTSYERNLLTTLVPEPKALPTWQMEAGAAKRMMGMSMLEARRRLREAEGRRQELQQQQQQQQRMAQQAQSQRKSSYAGFAISCHDEEDESEEQAQIAESVELPDDCVVEQIDDFFNIEEACEEDAED
jgi:hypothetical protein